MNPNKKIPLPRGFVPRGEPRGFVPRGFVPRGIPPKGIPPRNPRHCPKNYGKIGYGPLMKQVIIGAPDCLVCNECKNTGKLVKVNEDNMKHYDFWLKGNGNCYYKKINKININYFKNRNASICEPVINNKNKINKIYI